MLIESALTWIFNWVIGIIGMLIILRSVINFLIYLVHRMSPKKLAGTTGQRTIKDVGIEFFIGVMIVGLFLSGRWIVVVNALINFGNNVSSNI